MAAAASTAYAQPSDLNGISPRDGTVYRAIFDKLANQSWADAKAAILRLDADDPMRSYSLAELYLAKDSPRVELFDILDLLTKAPYLPQADQLSRLAQKRGAQALPGRPAVQRLMYTGSAPRRSILNAVAGDPVADTLRPQILSFIRADDPASASSAVEAQAATLSSDNLTELRQRVAWSYFIENDVDNARHVAALATSNGSGPYLAPSYWVSGLASWRQHNWGDALVAFAKVAQVTDDADLRSAGNYWAARAAMASHHPEQVSAYLRAAAREDESFYGLLARETLGLAPPADTRLGSLTSAERREVGQLPDVRIAATLASIGRTGDADEVLRHQAMLTGNDHYGALLHLAGDLSLPQTQLWLSSRSPSGMKPNRFSRYPMPAWTPAGGWRVDKALVFAHALQESRFQANAISAAGARGVLQVRPGTASEMAARAGDQVSASDLSDPAINLKYGQLYLEKLSTMSATNGLLAKVVAAYNAGPAPVERWKAEVRDEGDPLLFIESVPYYETRAYVNTVLRNYWMYQMEESGQSTALHAMAQGLWSRFPTQGQQVAIRLQNEGKSFGAD